MPTIDRIDRVLLQIPFVEQVQLDMERAGTHTWDEVELVRVECGGVVGWGETVQNYTWGRAVPHERLLGANPFELMWQDSLGAGMQMAMVDTAGKLAGVPAYRLLGSKIRDWCPISYWDHDMSPESYASEAQRAVELGYTSMKIKARPWWDVRETIRLMSEVTPDHFRIDADWNGTLNSTSHAIPLLIELEQRFPKLKMFEDPIPRDDAAGNRHLRTQIRTPIAQHYGFIPARTGIEMGGICDGWILGGGIQKITDEGAASEAMNLPFFLQMVGTGLTTSLSLHLSAVLKMSQWPTITCHELYEHCLLQERIPVEGGHAQVPGSPGLGVEVDEQAVERYRVEQADHSLPRRLDRVTGANGMKIHFATPAQKWDFFCHGNQPVDDWGCRTDLIEDDSTAEFAELHARATREPVITVD